MGCGMSGSESIAETDPRTLTDQDLLAILLDRGSCRSKQKASHLALAKELLEQHGSLLGLAKTQGEFLHGDNRRALFPVAAAFEVACRLAKARVPERKLLDRSATVAKYLALRYSVPDQEMMGALFLDVRNRLITEGEIFRGTLAGAMVEPRTILKKALLCSASAVILFHSHSSNDPTPSQEDVLFTERMIQAGKLLGVRILDHLILGVHDRWASLRRLGFISEEL